MKSDEIRESFLKFFEGKGHLRWPSASIVPLDDPTLLLMTAGMAPFKPYFSGKIQPPSRRMATCQKCVRADDVDRVGKTIRHHTFFEMLGNFSFGDYYKRETILWAWEYLTAVMGLPKDKLWITIHTDDDEAFDIWHKEVGVPKEKIIRLSDNFWGPVGDSGPCGPCSELCYDLGPDMGCGNPSCKPGCDCDRYLEVWNLVFTGLNKTKEGKLENLPAQCIDTGLGMERLTMVMQNKPTPFHTDLFESVIKEIEKISGKKFGAKKDDDSAIKIIADHARAACFMISDGINPSNQARGYVLRRFLRRCATLGQTHLNVRSNFVYKLTDSIVEKYKDAYKELANKKTLIKNLILQEEETFRRTLNNGLEMIRKEIEDLKKENKSVLSGDVVFKLYDTYGFPPELTVEIAKEHNFEIAAEEFKNLLDGQRKRSRTDLTEKLKEQTAQALEIEHSFTQNFVGDKELVTQSLLAGYNAAGVDVDLYINPTPFYAEQGGQIYDTGVIKCGEFEAEIEKVVKCENGVFVHRGRLIKGGLSKKDIKVTAEVSIPRRLNIMRNHTATHLLHSALRRVLGKHVSQTGSFVGDGALRFDFTHNKHLTENELKQVEDLVNEKIFENIEVHKQTCALDEALATGAIALFQEKYDKEVTVIRVGDFSSELCGGTHIDFTGRIGLFKILKESSVGTGVRRIEAVTGFGALYFFQNMYNEFETIKNKLNIKDEEVAAKVIKLYEEKIKKEKEIEALKERKVLEDSADYIDGAEKIKGINLIRKIVKDVSVENLRQLSDRLKSGLGSGVVVLGTVMDDKAVMLICVTKDLVEKGFNAGKIAAALAQIVGGKGGGRPDMAQAGGKDASKLQEALDGVGEIINSYCV